MSRDEQTQPSSLRFDNVQDALDHASHLVEDCINWHSFNNRNVVERYEKGEIQLVVKVRICAGREEYHLVFSVIPLGIAVDGESDAGNLDFIQQCSVAHGRNDLMLVSDAYLVEGPQKVIPSLVWLERSKDRVNLMRDISASSFQVLFERIGVSSEGEVGFLGTTALGSRNAVNGVVERIPEVAGCVSDNEGNGFGDCFGKFDLQMYLAESLRVGLNNSFVWVSIVEGAKLRVEVLDTFLSPSEFLPGTLKRISQASIIHRTFAGRSL